MDKVIPLYKAAPEAEVVAAINLVSGKYAAPLWDMIYEKTVAQDSLAALKDAIDSLYESGQEETAMRLIRALYDLLETEYPGDLELIEKNKYTSKIFLGEFIADIEDVMYDYEF